MHMQNFILIAGAETRRTFAKGDEKKYPGQAQLPVKFLWAVKYTEYIYCQKLPPCTHLVDMTALSWWHLTGWYTGFVVALWCLPI